MVRPRDGDLAGLERLAQGIEPCAWNSEIM
jgi:hypothetical protein